MKKLEDNNGFSWDDIFMWPADILWGGKENGPIFGGLYDDGKEEALTDAMRDAQQMYADYRPQNAQARTGALNQAMQLFGPANDRLEYMYGPGAGVDLQFENPLGQMFAPKPPPRPEPTQGTEVTPMFSLEDSPSNGYVGAGMTPRGPGMTGGNRPHNFNPQEPPSRPETRPRFDAAGSRNSRRRA